MGIAFITLRRRSRKLLEEIRNEPMSAWTRIELESVSVPIVPRESWTGKLFRLVTRELSGKSSSQILVTKHLFHDFINATGQVIITKEKISVRLQKRAHNPHLIAAAFDKIDIPVPWLEGKKFSLNFG